jgi:hypothetical protein
VSDWNDYLDLLLARDDLGAEEWRLAIALARNMIGYRKREDRLGDDLLRRASGLHGRSLERARTALATKHLIHYEAGTPGRGHRSLYRLPLEKPAPPRALPEKPAQKPAPARARSKQGKNTAALGKTPTPRTHAHDAERLFPDEHPTAYRDGT